MENLFQLLFNMSVTASWLILAVVIFRLLFKNAPKSLRSLLWTFVGIRLVCPFSFKSIFSLIPSTDTLPSDIMYTDTPTVHTGIPVLNSVVNPVISQSLAPDTVYSANPVQIWMFVASVLWLIGVTVMLLYAVISYIRTRTRVRESICYGDNVYICDNISSPFVFGFVKPKIYISSWMSREDIPYVLTHEKAHIARFDHLLKPLAFLLLSVYWFNPVIWLGFVLFCRDMELACDEKVIRTAETDVKKAYSEALINCSAKHHVFTLSPVAFGEVGVKGRIKSILSYKKPTLWVIVAALICCAVIAVCFLSDPREVQKTPPDDGIAVQLSAKDLIYDRHYPEISEKVTAQTLPVFNVKDGELFCLRSDATDFESIGELEYITLSDENYTRCFKHASDWYGEKEMGLIRGFNKHAWRVVTDGAGLDTYYILQQTDSEYYVILGSTDADGNTAFEYMFSMYAVSLSVSEVDDGIVDYGYTGSPDPTVPNISLSTKDKAFTFNYSGLSSYLCVGKYELEDGTLTLKTDDGLYTYHFKAEGTSLVFDGKSSSAIPSYKYSEDSEPQCPVPDGAVFLPIEYTDNTIQFSSPAIDSVEYDFDGNGVTDTCTLTYGPTSGVFTFFLSVWENGVKKYNTLFYSDHTELSFAEDEYGIMCVKAGDKYYRFGTNYGNIMLTTEDGEHMGEFN